MAKMTSRDILLFEKRKLLMKNLQGKKRLRKSPKWLYPYAVEREYTQYLVQYVEAIESYVERVFLPALKPIVNEANSEMMLRSDAWSNDFDKLMMQLQMTLNVAPELPNIKVKALDIGQKTSKWNSEQWQKTLRTVLGASTAFYEPWLQNALNSFADNNVQLIKTLSSDTFQNIRNMALQGINTGLRHEAIRDEIMSRFDATKNRAKLIARDQVSKLNGQLTKVRQENIGVDRYIWRGVNDERERKNHRNMNNRVCQWNDSTVVKSLSSGKWIARNSIGGVELHPGQDYQCRCWAEAMFDFTDEQGNVISTSAPEVSKPPTTPKLKLTHKQLQGTVKLPKAASRLDRIKKMESTTGVLVEPNIIDPKLLNDEAFEVLTERMYFYNRHFKLRPVYVAYEKNNDAFATTYGSLNHTESRLGLGSVWADDLGFKQLRADGMVFQWGVPFDIGKEYKSNVDHEMYHVLYNKVARTKNPPKQIQMIQDEYDKLSAEEISKKLGEYAALNEKEFGAECWNEYLNNSEPRPLAMKIGKLIHEMMEGLL